MLTTLLSSQIMQWNYKGPFTVWENTVKVETNCKLSENKSNSIGKSKTKSKHLNLICNGIILEIVNCFKHLGVNFNFNGNFSKWKKELSNQGLRALFSTLSKGKKLHESSS